MDGISADSRFVRIGVCLVDHIASCNESLERLESTWSVACSFVTEEQGYVGCNVPDYGAAGNEDRLCGSEIGVQEAVNYDFDLAGARLLGMDAGRIAVPSTHGQILTLLDDPAPVGRLVLHVAQGLRSVRDPLAEAEALLAQFRVGFQEARFNQP